MPTMLSQVVYGFAADAKPALIGEGDGQVRAARHEDFLGGMENIEESLGQLIVQNNADTERLNKLVAEQAFTDLSGSSSIADIASAINRIQLVLTNLAIKGKE